MAGATRLAVKNILWIPEIYPRHEVSEDRIAHFVDLMRSGKNLPPIKVSEYDGEDLIFNVDNSILDELKQGKYVLLDGKHRLETHIRLGIDWIEVFFFNTPSASWDFASARFNAEGPLQLCRGEWKDFIIRAYLCRLHAGRPITTNDIAEEIGGAVTVQYIRRVLKPFRDQERKRLYEEITGLHKKGLTQEEIAEKLHVGRKIVRNTLTIMSTLAQKKQFPLGQSCNINDLRGKKAPKVNIITSPENQLHQDTTQKQEEVQQQVAVSSGSGEDCLSATPDADTPPKNSKPANIIQFPTPSNNDGAERTTIPEELPATTNMDLQRELNQGENIEYDPRNNEDNAALDIYKLFGLDTPTGYMAMRALELAKQLRWDIPEISEFLDQSIDFVRQVFITALALQVCPNGTRAITKDKAASTLNLRYDIVDAIAKALHAEAMLAPEGEGMPEWVRANLSESDLELVATIASASGKSVIPDDIQYVLVGKTPPRQRTNYYNDVTPELARRMETDMQNVNVVLREYRDMLKTGLLREKALSFFIKVFNKARSTVNEVDDALLSCKKRGYL